MKNKNVQTIREKVRHIHIFSEDSGDFFLKVLDYAQELDDERAATVRKIASLKKKLSAWKELCQRHGWSLREDIPEQEQ